MSPPIGFILPPEHRWLGGQGYLFNLVSAYLEGQRAGGRTPQVWLCHAPGPLPGPVAPLLDDPAVQALPCPELQSLRRPARLAQIAWRGHIPSLTDRFRKAGIATLVSPTQFIGRPPGMRLLTWLPDFQHRGLPDQFTWARRGLREGLYRLCIRSSDAILLSSQDARSTLRSLPPPYGNAPVHVVPFTPTLTLQSAQRVQDVLTRHRLRPGFAYLPNQFWHHKNHALALTAVARLAAQGWQGQLVLSGARFDHRGPGQHAALDAQIADLTARGCVRDLGALPRADVISLFQACGAVINPSRFEGRASTVEEALALGVPLLLSDLPIHREQAGPNARYFDVDDPQGLADAIALLRPTPIRTRLADGAPARRAAFVAALLDALDQGTQPAKTPQGTTHALRVKTSAM